MRGTRRSTTYVWLVALGLCLTKPISWADISNGVHELPSLYVAPGETFTHSGGTLLVANGVTVAGWYGRGEEPLPAFYRLSAGGLACESLRVTFGDFTQSGGTNNIRGTLMLPGSNERSEYRLQAGLLTTSNLMLRPSGGGGMIQQGGRHLAGDLEVNALGWNFVGLCRLYYLLGGELEARTITLSENAIFRHAGGTLRHEGQLILAMGHWEAAYGEQGLGSLVVTNGAHGVGSSVFMPDGPAVLRFRQSSEMPWGATAVLRIRNWAGETNGQGQQRILIGTNQAGLTSAQLQQIRFLDPIGLPVGEYGARMLADGEIVPLVQLPPSGPVLAYHRDARGMIRALEWPPGYIVQSATNVIGPFTDAFGFGASPSAIFPSSDPVRFYRLRHWTTEP